MKKDVIIIGQGICGTFLHWWLEKEGVDSVVIDEFRADSPSRMASGVINPVTGRRLVDTWMIDKLLPFALNTYRQMEEELQIPCIRETSVVDFFPSPQMRIAFTDRQSSSSPYLHFPPNEHAWSDYFEYPFGFGEIKPVLLIQLQELLKTYRKKLIEKHQLLEEKFSIDECEITEEGIYCRDIEARHIIFCDGRSGTDNPFFRLLPFAPNKGEALVIDIPGLPRGSIFKKGMSLVPFAENTWWIGSSYEWEFENDLPTNVFRDRTVSFLKQWLKFPFTVLDHFSSVRPATLERRPFAGFHPLHKRIGILNGMGTKGCSLAPWFAREMAAHIAHGEPISPEADIGRFNRILERGG